MFILRKKIKWYNYPITLIFIILITMTIGYNIKRKYLYFQGLKYNQVHIKHPVFKLFCKRFIQNFRYNVKY